MSSTSAGLCEDCSHCRTIRSGRGSVFRMCRRHDSDPRYAKYPRLPVMRCEGYERALPTEAAPAAENAEDSD